MMEEKFYRQAIVFSEKGKSLLYLKQAGRREKLTHAFKTIENTLKVE